MATGRRQCAAIVQTVRCHRIDEQVLGRAQALHAGILTLKNRDAANAFSRE
jgi:hypothetical protein